MLKSQNFENALFSYLCVEIAKKNLANTLAKIAKLSTNKVKSI